MQQLTHFLKTIFFLVIILTVISCNQKPASTGGVSAADALATMQVPEGFKIEMIAAEPLITSPVDMEIDEYGRMYVVEMHGYPLDKSGSGNIVMLSDSNGDGIMDKRTLFKEGLILPTGILRWKKGFLITDSPNIYYLEDSDNDGKADIMDTVLTGFALTNPQHNLNNPVYGLDNWVYAAHEGVVRSRDYIQEFGDEGTEIYYTSNPSSVRLPQNASGRSVRFRPDKFLLEELASRCQFGHAFNQWGHWFGCNNSDQGYQEIIAQRYLTRNPQLPPTNPDHSMSDHLNAPEVFPTTTNPDRQILTDIGTMTSGSGLTVYLANDFPAPYNTGATFIAEPVSNLVHVDVLRDSSLSYVAGRVFPNKEFLTSTDAWSRPVNMYVGPDGALYVLDYYRRVIESPEWMSEEAIKAGNLYDGIDKGRIYRISTTDGRKADWTKGLQLGDATGETLVKELANANAWWRINAQRLLVDRADRNNIPALLQMAAQQQSDMGRLHALWTLEGMGALTPDAIKKALQDSVAGIRENAIKLAELHLKDHPELADALLTLKNDTNEKLRFQLLLTLGFIDSAPAAEARNNLLFRDLNNKWFQIAALSASSLQADGLLNLLLTKYQKDIPAYSSMTQRITAMITASADESTVHKLIQKSLAPAKQYPWQSVLLKGIAQGLRGRKHKPEITDAVQQQLINTFFDHPAEEFRKAALQVLQVTKISDDAMRASAVNKALAIIKNPQIPDAQRADAIDFLKIDDPSAHLAVLEQLVTAPQEQPVVKLAAIRVMNAIPSTAASEFLAGQWSQFTTEIRDAAVNVFMADTSRMRVLIKSMEAGKVPTNSVSFITSVQLMQLADENLRNLARKLFTKNAEEAKKINKEYQAALDLKGDAEEGRTVFMQNCALCHQMKGQMGVAFGPDLSTIHNWKREDILANILDPNLSIMAGYDLWEIQLTNGESAQGIIATETATAITIKNVGNFERTINRQDITSLKSLSISAMPTGLQKNISKEQMADLIAFLRQN